MASKFEPNRTNNEEVRIVMLGKTGNGKSASGNTILGTKSFKSMPYPESVTVKCSKRKATVDGRHVAVIDTPGLIDTTVDQEETNKAVCQSILYASPGPHIFLVVMKLNRYTDEEKQAVQTIQKLFGPAADKYSMVLFTGGDELEDSISIEEFLHGSAKLQELVARCNGQYHVFNNKLKERSQVTELFQKISEIVQKNGGRHYTNEMFQEAERAIEEEKQCLLRKKEEEMLKEIEKMDREMQERYEREREAERKRESEERAREDRELEMKLKEKFDRERVEERKREREERAREERELERKLKEKYEREREEARRKIQSTYENEARNKAEMNLFDRFLAYLPSWLARFFKG